jgi:hypothetical protein
MNKIIITENGVSNKPLAIITFNSEATLFDYWVRELEQNPDKYNLEMILQFTYTKDCAESFHDIYGGLCAAYIMKTGKLTKDRELAAFFGTMTGFSYAEEHINNKKFDEETD